jgi:hypothetical protein
LVGLSDCGRFCGSAEGGDGSSRTFQTEEAALDFIARVRADPEQEVRSWAEVRTTELPLPR